jgi:chromosome segregation ATPase
MLARPRADVAGMEAAVSDLFARPPLENAGASSQSPGEGLTAALSELEESTARLVSLRQKVERIGHEVAQRQQAILALERDLASARASADEDRETISHLERELDGHTGLIERVRSELTSLAGDLATPGIP